jgi:methylated-DNA-[protein]-cysteine S-methyltransferase
MTRYARFTTTLGPVYVTLVDAGVSGIYFEGGRHAPAIESAWQEAPDHPWARACAAQLAGYLAGTRRTFDLPLAPRGTAFQQRVWREIANVRYGSTITYAQLAARSGAPEAIRAAGTATGRNPLSIVVPCHRIVGSNGSLTGYAGGIERKRRLLELEGALEPALA